MFGNTARSLPRVHSYADAEKVFNQRGAVRSKRWAEHERPLYKTYYHYRVAKYDNHFDIILYSTVMARYYVPTLVDSRVHERRLYMGDNSITSKDFMHYVLGKNSWKRVENSQLGEVIAPVYNKSFMYDNDTPFSADFMYVDGVLDTTKSSHTPHHRMVSGNEDKVARAEVLKKFDNYLMLVQMRLPEFTAEATLSDRLGRPWAGGSVSEYDSRKCVGKIADDSATSDDIHEFFEMCQDAFNVLASKRAYKQKDFTLQSRWHTPSAPIDGIEKLEKQITADEVRKAVSTRILKALDLDKKSIKQTIPQFVVEKDYPRSNVNW
jgi:hypothetical protein